MPNFNLTDATVRSLKEGIYFDAKLPSFGIRVGKNRRTWIVLKGHNRTKIRLGHHPALPLAEARRRAHRALGTPLDNAEAPPFPDALNEFLSLDRWKPSSKYEIERGLRRHFDWTKPLDKITHQDVAIAIDAIQANSERAHALKDLKTFFSWCVPRYLKFSPCTGITSEHKYVPRSRLLSQAEFRAIWHAASKLDCYGALVQVLFTTGQRVGQFLDPDIITINDTQRLLSFKPSVMKGNREHVIPYGSLTAELLPKLQKMTYQGKLKGRLDEISSVTDWVLHDARRFFSSTHARLRTPIDITEALLSHVSGSRSQIQRVYDHYDRLPEMRDAVGRYENEILCIVE